MRHGGRGEFANLPELLMRRCGIYQSMSALPPIADINGRAGLEEAILGGRLPFGNVRFGSKADIEAR